MQSHTASIRATFGAIALALVSPALAGSLDVTPLFPAYGQEVVVQLSNAGPAPYVPATRYRRSGDAIVIELEHIAGGFFGPRGDMFESPLSLGELAPGRYSVQARLSDIANPDQPPRLFTRTIDVAAPDAEGVYAVPRNPGAYEPVELVVRAGGPIDAKSLRATVNEDLVRVDFQFTSDPAAATFATVKVAGLRPGHYRVQALGTYPNVMAPPYAYGGAFRVDTATTVVEYYSDRNDHYFMTASAEEGAGLDAGTTFKRTGERFKAWLRASDAPASAVPVYRFYAAGPNSHFYTMKADEYESLRALEQKDRAAATSKGEKFQGWAYEGVAFYAMAPRDGQCGPGTRAIYRAYNMRWAENDSNHRFTATAAMRVSMWTGWSDEGVAFCAPL